MRFVCCFCLLFAACGFPRPGDIGGDDAAPTDFTFTLASTRVHVVEGASATVEVNIGRNAFPDPVAVTVTGLPDGVTADPLMITDAG
ncbi:MAG TPA: hypothetical protein VFK02_14650 [Kofleriaceae bacterium]|nr:hypothetical protein [Kofleriaceae bacterium]